MEGDEGGGYSYLCERKMQRESSDGTVLCKKMLSGKLLLRDILRGNSSGSVSQLVAWQHSIFGNRVIEE